MSAACARRTLGAVAVVASLAVAAALLIAGSGSPPAAPRVDAAGPPPMRVHRPPRDDPGIEAGAVRRGGANRARQSTGAVPAPEFAPPLPSPMIPLDERIAQLQLLASSGRADAMLALGRALLDCRLVDPRDDQAIERHWIDFFLRTQSDNAETIDDAAVTEMVSSMKHRMVDLRERCARVDANGISHWLDWVEQAARAGDTQAMLDYAELAINARRDGEAPTAPADEIARRRALAREYLWRALQRGDCRALGQLALAHAGIVGDGDIASTDIAPDAAQAHAFTVAWLLWRGHGEASDENANVQGMQAAIATQLGATMLSATQAQGRAIYRQYCEGRQR